MDREPNPRLLIIEDDVAQLRTLSAIMRDEGFQVIGCGTGAEAMKWLTDGDARIDAAVVDLGLPDMDDQQLLRRLSAAAKDVPLIIYTGRSSCRSAIEALNIGAAAYVEKGGDPAKLVERVRQAIYTRLQEHTTALEDAVRRRTRQLEQANQNLQREIDVRKRAERVLRESETKYRTIFQHSPAMVILVDSVGHLVDVNDKTVELLGCPKEDFCGKHFSQLPFFSAATKATLQRAFERRMSGAEVPPYEVEFLRRDGAKLQCAIYGTVLRNGEGEIRHVLMIISDITERHQMERALLAVKGRAQQYLDIAGVMLVALDRQGAITLVNRRACELLGYKETELVGQDWFEMCLPGDIRDETRCLFRGLLSEQGNRSECHRNYIVARDGTKRLITWRNSLVRDGRGTVIGTLSSGEDVTDQVQAELALRESEAKYRALVESIPAVTYIASMDDASTTTYIAPQIKRYIGFSTEEYIADHDLWRKRLHHEDRERVMDALAKARASGEPFDCEYRMVAKDGREVWFHDTASIVRDDQGKEIALQGIMFDVTGRKRAEGERVRSERELSLVFDTTPVMMIVVDPAGRIHRANRAARTAHGGGEAKINGERIGNLLGCVHALDRPDACGLQSACETCLIRKIVVDTRNTGNGHVCREQRLDVARDGRETQRYLRVSSAALLGAGSDYVLLSIEDGTKQREAEDELRGREAELARINRLHVVGEMAGTLIHELSQPLYAINNYVRGVQHRLRNRDSAFDADDLTEVMELVAQEVIRTTKIVTHLREFVRGREPRRSSVDIGAVVRTTVRLASPAARDQQVTLEHDVASDLPLVQADATQLEQILVNLVANAIDAVSGLPAERRRVTIAVCLSHAETLDICVRDNGRGVSTDYRDKLFEPFATSKRNGLGMGLAISRSIVRSHGGKIWFVDNQPHGAAFHVTLPVHTGDQG